MLVNMIVIQHKGGWSVSNNAWLDTKRTPIIENGKTTGIKSEQIAKWTNPYTVEGDMSGDCRLAIRDDSDGRIYYYEAVLDGKYSALIVGEVDKNFLVTL